MHYNVAVVGATGVVGEVLFELLEQRGFPINNLYPLASERSVGASVEFRERSYEITNLEDFDFSLTHFAFFSAGAEISAKYAKKAAASGCIVIDNTSYFRYDKDVPLIVPEVNAQALMQQREVRIIANPNCSTIQMVLVLKPIYDAVGIERVNVATYQSVSGAGKKAIEELAKQTAALLNGEEPKSEIFDKQIAFNVIPQIDVFEENGYTKEEMKMVLETRKILADESLRINPTAVRVPVFYGHSEALHIETKKEIAVETVRHLLAQTPGITVAAGDDYPTPISHAASQDDVFVGRIRQDISHPRGINLWVVADNVRKGAALNAVQIAELFIRNQRVTLH